ncbi:MAG: tetratricopeptide repeat protein [Pyrinomonadaceae bacterium]
MEIIFSNHDESARMIDEAEALIAVERFAEAGEVLARGLSQEPENYTLLCLMAQVMFELERWADARRYAEQAVVADPEQAWAHRLLGHILRQCARQRDAVVAAKEAVRLEPYEPSNLFGLVSAQLDIFALKDARASATRLRELAPDWWLSHQALALVALKQEKYKEAEEHCRRELELNPTSYHGMNNLGVALLNRKRDRDAIDTFHRAAKLSPAEPTARANLLDSVSKNAPRIGLGALAIWIIAQGFRVIVTLISLTKGILVALLIAAVATGIFLFLRWNRFRQLPVEVRQFYLLSTTRERREARRSLFFTLGVAAIAAFVIWWLVVYAYWNEVQQNWGFWLGMIPPVILCIVGAGAWLGNLRNRNDD